MKITHCRSCGGPRLHQILDLGEHPLPDALLTKEFIQAGRKEPHYPLRVVLCLDCALLQVEETVPPEDLFQQDYPYYSSSSQALLEHARAIAERLIEERHLGGNSLVIEVACNDGYLLRNFVRHRIPCLGIDPASGPAHQAFGVGVPISNEFFSSALANTLAAAGNQADVMIANNVVAHVDQINDFVAGFATLLKPDGIAVFECAYAADLIEALEFDTIYHEHLFYHTLHSLTPLFERHGLHINDVEHLPVHGGSLRVFVSKKSGTTARHDELWRAEKIAALDRPEGFVTFARKVAQLRDSLRDLLLREKAEGKRIVCYGAAAKGSTMINYLDLGPDFFEYVVDLNPHKQGKFMPGQKIPIYSPDRLMTDRPDLVLLLVWNFAGEVLRQQAAYRQAGGRFLIPVPEPWIVEPGGRIADTQFVLRPEAMRPLEPAMVFAPSAS